MDSNAFVAAIAGICARRSIDIVLPMTEVTTSLLTEAGVLPAGTAVPFPDSTVVKRAADKGAVLQLAQELGVPIPRTIVLASPSDLAQGDLDLGYPIVIKPTRSRIRTASSLLSTGVTYAVDREDLDRRIAALPPAVFPVLLQERVEGPGVGLFACYDDGRAVALFAHRRLREKPPSGGVSVLSESAPLNPVAVDYADRLLRALNWKGVAMVEFKQDRLSGELRLMEINGRFWGSLQLAVDAGVDFPAIAAALAAGAKPAAVPEFRVGVRTRWFWGDVDSCWMVLSRSRARLDLPPHHPGRAGVLWEFIKSWGPGVHDEIFRFDDPKPWWLETRRRLRS